MAADAAVADVTASPADATASAAPETRAAAPADAAASRAASVRGDAAQSDAPRIPRLVFSQPDSTGPQRWADPWSVTLEIPAVDGAITVREVGAFTLTSPEYGACPARPGVARRFDESWGVGGGSYGLALTFRGRVIAWDFVEVTEGDDARQGGASQHTRGRVDVPAGVASDRVLIVCR